MNLCVFCRPTLLAQPTRYIRLIQKYGCQTATSLQKKHKFNIKTKIYQKLITKCYQYCGCKNITSFSGNKIIVIFEWQVEVMRSRPETTSPDNGMGENGAQNSGCQQRRRQACGPPQHGQDTQRTIGLNRKMQRLYIIYGSSTLKTHHLSMHQSTDPVEPSSQTMSRLPTPEFFFRISKLLLIGSLHSSLLFANFSTHWLKPNEEINEMFCSSSRVMNCVVIDVVKQFFKIIDAGIHGWRKTELNLEVLI